MLCWLAQNRQSAKKKYRYLQNSWVTEGLLRNMREKKNMHRKAERRPFDMSSLLRYKNYYNAFANLRNHVKKRYYEHEFEKYKSNAKKQWELLNSFLNKDGRNVPVTKIKFNGDTYTDPVDISNAFSNYFHEMNIDQPIGSCCDMKRIDFSFYLFSCHTTRAARCSP